MKKLILLCLILLLAGCATPGLSTESFRKNLADKKDWPNDTKQAFLDRKVKIGMTKEQIFWLAGSPLYWTKYPTKDGIFESWFYSTSPISSNNLNYDFKDGILIGYSGSGKYTSANPLEDVRDFEK